MECAYSQNVDNLLFSFLILPLGDSVFSSHCPCLTAPDSAFKASRCASKAPHNTRYHETHHNIPFNTVKHRTDFFCAVLLCLAIYLNYLFLSYAVIPHVFSCVVMCWLPPLVQGLLYSHSGWPKGLDISTSSPAAPVGPVAVLTGS